VFNHIFDPQREKGVMPVLKSFYLKILCQEFIFTYKEDVGHFYTRIYYQKINGRFQRDRVMKIVFYSIN